MHFFAYFILSFASLVSFANVAASSDRPPLLVVEGEDTFLVDFSGLPKPFQLDSKESGTRRHGTTDLKEHLPLLLKTLGLSKHKAFTSKGKSVVFEFLGLKQYHYASGVEQSDRPDCSGNELIFLQLFGITKPAQAAGTLLMVVPERAEWVANLKAVPDKVRSGVEQVRHTLLKAEYSDKITNGNLPKTFPAPYAIFKIVSTYYIVDSLIGEDFAVVRCDSQGNCSRQANLHSPTCD